MIDLVGQMSKDEAGYIRSKVASLWIELSKRCWGDAWVDLDELLQQIWTISETDARYINYKIFVLYVLECLSDDICVRDDPVALLRQEILGQSLNEIMISPKLYDKHREEREGGTDMRFADEGWMLRICRLLSHLVESISGKQTEYSPMIIAALEALKPTVNWISLEAIIETDCVNCIFQTLEIDDEKIRLVSQCPSTFDFSHRNRHVSNFCTAFSADRIASTFTNLGFPSIVNHVIHRVLNSIKVYMKRPQQIQMISTMANMSCNRNFQR